MKGMIRQIAVLVEDVDKAMKNYWELLGIGPWEVRHFCPGTCHDFYVNGERLTEGFDFICAVCWHQDVELELIQPIKGPNVYWDTLKRKGQCLHHFKVVIKDTEELKAYVGELEEKGMKVMQTGWIDGDVHYYIDSEEQLGFIMELGNGGEIGSPDYRYPEEVVQA